MLPSFHVSSYVVATSVIAVVTALDVAVVGARFYIRRALKQQVNLGDWSVIPALALVIGMATAMFIGIGQDALFSRRPNMIPLPGKPLSGFFVEAFMISKKIEFSIILMSITTLALIKLSFLVFYKRVFVYDKGNIKDLRNVVINIMIAIIIVWQLGFTLTLLSSCKGHFGTRWKAKSSKELETRCINTFLMLYAFSISDFVTDCIIILIPIPMIWRLHLSLGRKVGTCLVFLLGSLATLASLIRLLWIRWVMAIGSTPHAHGDPLSLLSTEVFWYTLECAVALLAACLPPLSGFRRVTPVERMIRSVQSKLSLRSGSSSNGAVPHLNEAYLTPSKSESLEDSNQQQKDRKRHVGVLPDVESQRGESR